MKPIAAFMLLMMLIAILIDILRAWNREEWTWNWPFNFYIERDIFMLLMVGASMYLFFFVVLIIGGMRAWLFLAFICHSVWLYVFVGKIQFKDEDLEYGNERHALRIARHTLLQLGANLVMFFLL